VKTDDHYAGLRRRCDAGTRWAGWEPQGRIRARRMGSLRQPGRDVRRSGLPAGSMPCRR